MYTDMRKDLVLKLTDLLPDETLKSVIQVFDEVSVNYSISKNSIDLAIRGRDEMENYAKLYVVCKKLEGCSEATIENYANSIRIFIQYMQCPLEEIDTNAIRKFLLLYKMDHDITDRSLDKLRSTIASWFLWMQNEGYIERNPFANMKRIKFEAEQKPALEQTELERLRESCRDDRERALVEVLYSTGCRITEILNLKTNDVDWDDEHPECKITGKGNKKRMIYFTPRAVYAVKRYLSGRSHNSEWLFTNDRGGGQMHRENAERIFRQLRKLSGLDGKKLTPHTLRHTTATQTIKIAPVEVVRKLLGHTNINTTMIYAESAESDVKRYHSLLQ